MGNWSIMMHVISACIKSSITVADCAFCVQYGRSSFTYEGVQLLRSYKICRVCSDRRSASWTGRSQISHPHIGNIQPPQPVVLVGLNSLSLCKIGRKVIDKFRGASVVTRLLKEMFHYLFWWTYFTSVLCYHLPSWQFISLFLPPGLCFRYFLLVPSPLIQR